ncbi:hypothetical protein BKAS_1231 [Bifidobacterium catenulatum subsp. kashiwanohense JCM 15439 = DSM 21854]|nr:hypothetical protein BKAS_1231 [Bifidobacterium catenulatum subsp. kashiwanohense JCM 15439 = DSM 21854]
MIMISGFSFTYLLGPSKDNRYFLCGALNASKATSRRNRQPTCSAPDHGLGMAGPIYSVGVVRSISFWKCHRAPTVWLPELTQGCRYSLALGSKPPLINRDIFSSIPSGLRRKNQKVFFHAFKATLDRLANRLLMYALGLGNFLNRLAKNDICVNSTALDLRQRIESVPQTKKGFHPFKKLLRGRLMQAGGIFNPVIAVQRILRLVPGEPPLVGHFVAGIGLEYLGNLVRNFDKLILRVPNNKDLSD